MIIQGMAERALGNIRLELETSMQLNIVDPLLSLERVERDTRR